MPSRVVIGRSTTPVEKGLKKEGSLMRIVVDPDKCTGLGMCEAEAPDLFEVDDEGSLTILNDTPTEEQRAAAEAAVDACPTEALSVELDDPSSG
jgi:ferredoxin